MRNFDVFLFVSTSYKKCVFIFLMFQDFDLFSSQYIDFNLRKYYQVHVFVVIYKISKIANFIRNYLENDNESEFTVKTKNAPFFMNFPRINKNGNFFSARTGPLRRFLYIPALIPSCS